MFGLFVILALERNDRSQSSKKKFLAHASLHLENRILHSFGFQDAGRVRGKINAHKVRLGRPERASLLSLLVVSEEKDLNLWAERRLSNFARNKTRCGFWWL